MNPRRAVPVAGVLRAPSLLPSGPRSVLRSLLRALAFVVAAPLAASADDLESVDEALVLYVGAEISPDGDAILDILDDVISSVIGKVQIHVSDGDTESESVVEFQKAYSDFSCLAAWPAHFARDGSWFDPLVSLFTPEPSFFRPLERYGTEPELLPQCSRASPAHTFLGPDEPREMLSFVVSDTDAPDWKNIELGLREALGGVVPPSGASALSTLICPRILQIRTPVRAAVRLRPQVATMADLIRTAADSLPPLPGRGPLDLLEPVAVIPTVAFRNGTHDFSFERQPEHNVIDVYFEHAAPLRGRVHGPGSRQVRPEHCLDHDSADWPASRNLALRLDQSLRFVWKQVGASTIDPAIADDSVRCRLDVLAGRTFETFLPPFGTATGSHGDFDVCVAAAPAPDPAADAREPGGADVAAPQPAVEPAPGFPPMRTTVDASRQSAPHSDRSPVETWTVIEAYEDLDSWWHTHATEIESTDVAVDRADAVRSLLPANTRSAPTGFGRVSDFADFPDSPTIVVERDRMHLAGEAELKTAGSSNNRTAFLTTFDVPVVSAASIPEPAPPEFRIRKSSVYTLAHLRARQGGERCLSFARRDEAKELLETYRSYFLGPAYAPFADLPEHKEAVLLLCAGHGPAGDLTGAKLGPALLRALHKQYPGRFARENTDIRATLLHQIGEVTARRYYLFGHSILTHFQPGTKADILRKPAGAENLVLCGLVPGLRVIERGDPKTDVCEVDSDGNFAVQADKSVAGKLYDVTLPTTLDEQVRCEPVPAAAGSANSATHPEATAVEPSGPPAPRRRGCGDDELPDPHAVLAKMSSLPYVFRAALDVAYAFVPPR